MTTLVGAFYATLPTWDGSVNARRPGRSYLPNSESNFVSFGDLAGYLPGDQPRCAGVAFSGRKSGGEIYPLFYRIDFFLIRT